MIFQFIWWADAFLVQGLGGWQARWAPIRPNSTWVMLYKLTYQAIHCRNLSQANKREINVAKVYGNHRQKYAKDVFDWIGPIEWRKIRMCRRAEFSKASMRNISARTNLQISAMIRLPSGSSYAVRHSEAIWRTPHAPRTTHTAYKFIRAMVFHQ